MSLCTSRVLLLALLVSLGAACRSAPPLGVQRDFRRTQITQVILHPFYLSATMGLSEAEQQRYITQYEALTGRWFERRGVKVLSAAALSHHLTERGVWQRYQDGIALQRALFDRFQDAESPELAIEIDTLRQLSRAGYLPPGELLLAEIVYQGSSPACYVAPETFNERALVITSASAAGVEAPPCFVSHLRSKLVDPGSGRTIWMNERLVEQRIARRSPRHEVATVARVIEAVFGEREGLASLLAGEEGSGR